jgi:hypothetical protein
MGVAEFAEGVAQGLQESLKFPATDVLLVRNRLERLLSITPLGIRLKSKALKSEYERKFCTSRILTDARPVYVYDPKGPPEAVMITHTLRITFHDDTGELREFFVRMDGDDLLILRDLLDRAEAKEESLRAVFRGAAIPVVEP